MNALKLYENTANYNTLPPKILSFQYIAPPLILRAPARPGCVDTKAQRFVGNFLSAY